MSSLMEIRVATGLLSLCWKKNFFGGLGMQQHFFEMQGFPSKQSSQLCEDFQWQLGNVLFFVPKV